MKMKSKKEKTPAEIAIENAKKSFRLPPDVRARLIFDLITTNKTFTNLAKEYGIHVTSVSSLYKRLKEKSRGKWFLFKGNGKDFFGKN